MCGGRRPSPPPAPEPVAPAPVLRTPAPARDVPTPEDIRRETDDPNIITGKKRKKLKVDTVRKGTKVYDAVDPGMDPGTPEQGIPAPK